MLAFTTRTLKNYKPWIGTCLAGPVCKIYETQQKQISEESS